MTVTPEDIEEIKALLLRGATADTILAATGLGMFVYRKLISENTDLQKARAEGKFQKRTLTGKTLNTPLGAVAPSLKGYEKVFVDWLVGEVPTGGTVADVLVSSAYDAFTDERDALTGDNTTEGTTP